MKVLTKKWIEFARQDLKDGEILFIQKSYRNAAWHCHQSIEKILKAIIVENSEEPRKIHDLIELVNNSRTKLPVKLMDFLEELNLFYLPPRYPDMYEQVKKFYEPINVRKALKLTRILFLWLRNLIK